MNPMIIAGILFVVSYVLLLALPKGRAWVALAGGVSFILAGILPVSDIISTIDWNVLMMIGGTMGLVALFIDSKMPNLLADILLEKISTVRAAMVALALFAGIISAFIDNVATVLMIAPVALAIAKRLDQSPVPMVIAIAVSSNLQGAATLVGDTTSILLGAAADMDFMDFFWYQGRPGIFWVVQAGAVLSALILYWLFRDRKETVDAGERTKVTDYVPAVLLVSMVALLAGASFIPGKPALTNGIICVVLFAVGLIYEISRQGTGIFKPTMEQVDIQTLLQLTGIFLIVGGVEASGLLEVIAGLFVKLSGGSLFIAYSLILWGSVACSAFIDNIPYVAAMLPVTAGISATLGVQPTLLYFGLLIGATLGGNLTPVGASANITGIGMLRTAGHDVSNKDFMHIGVPFTLTAVMAGYILVWLLWA